MSINETGKGKLHKITYKEALLNTAKDLGSIIEMDLVGTFRAGTGKKYDPNLFFQVDLCTHLGIIITSQNEGQIQIFTLNGLKKICTLNQPRNFWMPLASQTMIHGKSQLQPVTNLLKQSKGGWPNYFRDAKK